MAVRSSSLDMTMSSAEVAVEPTPMALTRIARRQVAGGQPGVLLERALDGAVADVAAPGDVSHDRRDADDGPTGVVALEHARHGGPHQGVAGRDVEAEGLLQEARRGVEQRPRHGAAHVVDDDVEPAELAERRLGQRGDEVEVGQVAGHHDGPTAGGLHLLGDGTQLVLGAGGQHDVGSRLGQRDRGGGADAAPAGGDDGDLVGDEESIEDHPANVVGPATGPRPEPFRRGWACRRVRAPRRRAAAVPIRAMRLAQPIWSSRTGKGFGITLAFTSSGRLRSPPVCPTLNTRSGRARPTMATRPSATVPRNGAEAVEEGQVHEHPHDPTGEAAEAQSLHADDGLEAADGGGAPEVAVLERARSRRPSAAV